MLVQEKETNSCAPEEIEQKLRSLLGPWIFRIFRLKYRELSIRDRESVMGYPYATQERATREQQLQWDKQAIRGAWEEETRSFPQLAKELSSIMQQTQGPRIEGIKVFSRAFLLEYRRIMGGALEWKNSDWMSDEELKDLTNLAVFTYLEMWLDNDKASYLTIEQFAKYGYRGTDGVLDDKLGDENWKSALHSAYKTYEDMYKKGQLHKKELSGRPHPTRYKRDNKIMLSLLDLAWCEAWASGQIEILKIIFFRKTLPNRKSEHDTRQNELLRDALNRYARFVNGIGDNYPTDKKQIDQYKAYLARCILVQRLERDYRFTLAGCLADYAVKNGYRPDAYNQELFSTYIGIYQDEIGMLISNKKLFGENGERKYNRFFSQYRTLSYEEIPEKVFEIRAPEQIEHAHAAEAYRRNAMDNLIEMLCVCGQIDRCRWEDEDYRSAVAFLGNEYQFLNRLAVWEIPVPPGSKDQWTEGRKATEQRMQKFLDYFYAYYLGLYEDDHTQTKRIIQELTETKKKGKKPAKK